MKRPKHPLAGILKNEKMIRRFLILTLLVVLSYPAFSQDGKTSILYTPDSVKHINVSPLYPGEIAGLMKDIQKKLVIPKQAKKDKLQGKIYLQFTIDTIGYVVAPKIIKGLREDLDNAVLEMTTKLQKFTPATMDGKKVSFTVNLPLKF